MYTQALCIHGDYTTLRQEAMTTTPEWAAWNKPRCHAEVTVANGRMAMNQAGRCRRNAAPGSRLCAHHTKTGATEYVRGA